MRIAVVDLSDDGAGLEPELRDAVRAVQRQTREDFAPIWGTSAELVIARVNRAKDFPSGVRDLRRYSGVIYVSPEAGVERTAEGARTKVVARHFDHLPGLPCGFVFPNASFDWSGSWTVALSHQILEMLADPDINRLVSAPHEGRVVFRAYEVCDPVQTSSYAVDGVRVSNFVTPQYFKAAPRHPTGLEPTNFLDEPLAPFDVLPGGTFRYFDPKTETWESPPVPDAWAEGRREAAHAPRMFRRELRTLDGTGIGWASLSRSCSNGLCTS